MHLDPRLISSTLHLQGQNRVQKVNLQKVATTGSQFRHKTSPSKGTVTAFNGRQKQGNDLFRKHKFPTPGKPRILFLLQSSMPFTSQEDFCPLTCWEVQLFHWSDLDSKGSLRIEYSGNCNKLFTSQCHLQPLLEQLSYQTYKSATCTMQEASPQRQH